MKKLVNEKSTFKRILSYALNYKWYLVGALASAIVAVVLQLLVPVLIGNGIDFIVGPGNVNYQGILRVVIFIGISIAISSVFQWFLTHFTNIVSYNTVEDIRVDAFNKLNRMPLNYIDTNSHGDIINRVVNDTDIITDGLLQGFTQLFTGIVTIIGTLFFMLSINVLIAVVVVVLTPLSIFVASFIANRSYHMFRSQTITQGEIGGYIEEMIGSQKVVKAFTYEDRAQDEFEEINSRLYDVGVKAQFYSSLTRPAARFINSLVYAAVGIIGAIGAVRGILSVGQISSFLIYADKYTTPFNEVTGVVTQLQSALASAERVFQILDEPDQLADSEDAIDKKTTNGNIDMDDVEFSYIGQDRFIENLDISVKQGDKIAIVGPTGCGKTTIINLLMRFYDVSKGSIKVDGIDIRDIKRNSLRDLYGMVLQETWLFSGTVRDNIAYGKPDATMEEVIKAAKMSHAHGFIKQLPNGYDTIISEGEGGQNVSHGQKQLLCIARVMIVEPPMLILDEATSSIDTMTEIRVQKAFNTLMKGRTSFVVAHRLSTIMGADTILVMNDGAIIETGSHQELLEQGGFYSDLYNSQFAVK